MVRFDKESALVIVDMLNDFVREGAVLEVPAARALIPALQKAREAAYRAGAVVIYVCDNHRRDDPEFKAWPPHAVAGSDGAQVVGELAPGEKDLVVAKRRFSGFFGTDLDLYLREAGIKRIVLAGVLTDICVYHTAADACMRGYEVSVLTDCVAALTEQDHNFALKQMQRLFGAALEKVGET